MADTLPLLELCEVTRTFPGVTAVDRVSFDLRPGEVHALVGENGAGKSTLIRLIAGVLQPDAGELRLRGRPLRLANPVAARRAGIVTVHQETELFPALSLAENIGLEAGLLAGGLRRVRWADVFRHAQEIADAIHQPLDVRLPAGALGVGQRQMIQVATAVLHRADVLLLDEPTSSLSAGEVAWLYDQIRRLKAAGAGVIYISHRQDEVFALADRITVLRDGSRVWSGAAPETNRAELVRHMVGRTTAAGMSRRTSVRRASAAAPPRLRLIDWTDSAARFTGVNLELRGGEVAALYGLVGAGRSELAQAVFGLRPTAGGRIEIDGQPVDIRQPTDAVGAGIAYLPEDRLRQGVCRGLSVEDNLALASLRRWTHRGVIAGDTLRAAALRQAHDLAIKLRGLDQPLGQLSGGNQQKAVLGRWLLAQPRTLILDEPTRGVDVGAKEEIHRLLAKLADDGAAVLLITSDLPEALENADRVLVLRQGRLSAEFDGADATPEAVAAAALPEETAANAVVSASQTRSQRRRIAAPGHWGLVAALAALVTALAFTSPQFLTVRNMAGVLAETSVWGILSLAAGTVILAGGIDISLGSLLALSATVAGLVLQTPWPPSAVIPLAMAAALATGTLGGLVNAHLAIRGGVHPIVITLGTMTVYRGTLILLTGGDTVGNLPPAFGRLATANLAGVGGAVVWLALAAVVAHFVLAHTALGRQLYAYGNSPSAAQLIGVSQRRAWLTAYALCGLLTGLAGLLALARSGQMQSGLGVGYELQAIAATVIGGTAISGGRGSAAGMILGALLLSLLYNALVLWQVSVYRYDLVIGALLLAAVTLDRLGRKDAA